MKKNYCKVFKTCKEGQSSFRITKRLIDTVYKKARIVKKKAMVVLTIPIDKNNNYRIEGIITKEKQ